MTPCAFCEIVAGRAPASIVREDARTLAFIGIKLVITWAHETWPDTVPKIPTNVSLAFIITVLVITGIASWLKVRKDPTAVAHAGRITGGDHHEDGPAA